MHPERLAAALRLLRDSGDITPLGSRLLKQINDAEQITEEDAPEKG